MPVKTEKEVPKEKIFACMEEIRRLTVKAPVWVGQVVMENIAGTGVALVATRNVDQAGNILDKL